MTDQGEPIRISDAERNDAAERLNGFFGDGRLTHEEFSSRLDEVYTARTDLELRDVFRGLPRTTSSQATLDVQAPPPRSLRNRVERGAALCMPAALCTAIWEFTTAPHYFWPEWVWLPTGLAAVGGYLLHRRREEKLARYPELRALKAAKYQRRLDRHEQKSHWEKRAGEWAELPFLAGHPAETAVESTEERRAILSVVFVDIVGSTERAAALGDRGWRDVLGRFEQAVDGLLLEHHGRKIFTKGDEIVATFRAPALAIGFAQHLREKVHALELQVRTGIHTGEVEGPENDLSGITLHVGQRVSSVAVADEILVSSTVRDITFGSGIEFLDHGEHELRGFPGTWHLYSVGATPGH